MTYASGHNTPSNIHHVNLTQRYDSFMTVSLVNSTPCTKALTCPEGQTTYKTRLKVQKRKSRLSVAERCQNEICKNQFLNTVRTASRGHRMPTATMSRLLRAAHTSPLDRLTEKIRERTRSPSSRFCEATGPAIHWHFS